MSMRVCVNGRQRLEESGTTEAVTVMPRAENEFWCWLTQVKLDLMAVKQVCRCRRCCSTTNCRLHLVCIIAAVVCVIVVVVIVVGVLLMLLICYR